MSLLWFLLRASWPTVLLAGAVGAVSGAASMGLVAAILDALRRPGASSSRQILLFVGLCLTVLVTRIVSQVFLARLTQNSVFRLRVGLCQRVLDLPLRDIEEIGVPKIQAVLTGDVGMVSGALGGMPGLAVNGVIILCGAAYLGWLSPALLAGAVAFSLAGFASYACSAAFARRYDRQARTAEDELLKHVSGMVEGIKEMKMHRERRRAFMDRLLQPTASTLRANRIASEVFQNAAIAWGRLAFFVAVGLLLFLWPRIRPTDGATLTGYALTILYLMSPLEQILAWLPYMAYASGSAARIDRLGLTLGKGQAETSTFAPIDRWRRIEISGVTHSYRKQGREHEFILGPVDLAFGPAEVVFIVGGNGSGKTTLLKLIAGLYVPDTGVVRVDGRPVADDDREGYRQLFTAVFDDATVFESLLGLESHDVDALAQEYLRQLELDRVVTVRRGSFSSTALSRGQRKRLALLTAYIEDRPIYLFDEWAADQDPVFKKVFYQRIVPDLRRRGKAVIAVTHDDRYFSTADRLIKLDEGRVVTDGAARVS